MTKQTHREEKEMIDVKDLKRVGSVDSDATFSSQVSSRSSSSQNSSKASITSSVRRLVRGRINTDLSLRDIKNTSQRLNDYGVSITPLERVPYVHGGYAAVAPMFVRDEVWMDILELLMPECHREGDLLAKNEGPSKIMKWAEHNPVVTAYGMLQGEPRLGQINPYSDIGRQLQNELRRQKESSLSNNCSLKTSSDVGCNKTTRIRTKEPNVTPIEWDVFLDPNLVAIVDNAMEQAQQCTDIEQSMVAEIEVDRQVGRLISRMLLAHGSTGQLVTEALGIAKNYNFSRVAQTTQPDYAKSMSQSMGIFVERWLHLFLSALKLADRFALRRQKSATSRKLAMAKEGPKDVTEIVWEKPFLCGLFLCLGITDPNSSKADHAINSIAITLREIANILGSPLSVVLDLKTRRVPPRVWARLIDNLRTRGLCIHGIGSFDIKELRSITESCCCPVTPIIFFHAAGDLQRACHADEIKRGDHVYFNAGSLLWQRPDVFDAAKYNCCNPSTGILEDSESLECSARYVIHPFAYPSNDVELLPLDLQTSTIEQYQRYYNLQIGLYVQEFSICQEALEVLINFVNFSKSVYKLGMSYGGLNGATVNGLTGDGYWNQRYVGRNWDISTGPTDTLTLAPEDNFIIREAIVEMGGIGTLHEEDEVAKAIQKSTCVVNAAAHHENPFEASRLHS